MVEHDQQDDVLSKRLTQGQDAKRLLQEPLIEGFFADQYAVCYKAFCDLPMGSSVAEYQTVHHDYLALQRLHDSLQGYIQRAEMDVLEARRQDAVPEGIEI